MSSSRLVFTKVLYCLDLHFLKILGGGKKKQILMITTYESY